MKKIFMLLFLIIGSAQLLVASDDHEEETVKTLLKKYDQFVKKLQMLNGENITNEINSKSLQYITQYLRTINDLKRAHKIPRLIVTSIINDTPFDLTIANKFFRDRCLLKAEEETEISSFIKKQQQTISRENRILGACDLFYFFIEEINTLESLSTEYSTPCWIDLSVELNKEEDDDDDNSSFLNLPSINKFFVSIITKHNKTAHLSLLTIENNDYQSNEIKVTIKISESDNASRYGKFRYCCKLAKNES